MRRRDMNRREFLRRTMGASAVLPILEDVCFPQQPAPFVPETTTELCTMEPDGRIRLRFHPGQIRAWNATERFVGVFAGTQGGKTSWGPWWLHREIGMRGPGDYLAVTSTYDLFKLKMLPSLKHVFEEITGIGRYWPTDRVIEIKNPHTGEFQARRADDPMWARIILRSADTGGGLESSTAKAAWLDEAGMDRFTRETWWAVLRRLSLSMGRALLSTTLYNFGWIKKEFYDRWRRGERDYKVIHFDSTENPNFPREEWRRAKATLPGWRFEMQYRGRFERPFGLIYDSYSDEYAPAGHLVARAVPPVTWPRYPGLDFGGVNTACVFLAEEPISGRYVAYREYLEGDRTAAEHVSAIRRGEPEKLVAVGGSHGEGQWRKEFRSGGLLVLPPAVKEVEIGINRVYAGFRSENLYVMDHLEGLRDELKGYSRELGPDGEPTEEIENKSNYHRLDALRYVYGWLVSPNRTQWGRNRVAEYRAKGRRGRR